MNAENKVKIAEAGGIEAIVQAMGRHGEDKGVQEAGCGALGSLGWNAQNKVKIAEAGGLMLAQKAWDKHRHATATKLIPIVHGGRRRIQTLYL